jgi:hypothetical protein
MKGHPRRCFAIREEGDDTSRFPGAERIVGRPCVLTYDPVRCFAKPADRIIDSATERRSALSVRKDRPCFATREDRAIRIVRRWRKAGSPCI